MKAMILAAGRGERLRPLTDTVPKPLVEVAGEALLLRHLRRLGAAGIGDVVINVSHLGHLIEQRVGSGSEFGVSVQYSREPDGPLETAGGIARALPLLGAAPFAVVNGDIWCDFDFADLPRHAVADDGAAAHLVVVNNPAHHPAGDFRRDGDRLRRGSGHDCTYAGIGVFMPDLFSGLGAEPAPLAPILFRLAAQNRLGGRLHHGRWFDIGSVERLAEAEAALSES